MIADNLAGLRDGGSQSGQTWADLAASMTRETDVERFLQSAGPFIAATMFGEPAYQDQLNWQGRVEDWRAGYGGPANVLGQYGGLAGQMGRSGAMAQTQGMNRLAQAGLGRSGQMAALASQVAQQTGAQQAGAYGQMSAQQSQIDAQHRQRFSDRYLAARNSGVGNAMDALRVVNQLALGHNVQPRTWIDSGGGDDASFYGGLGQGLGRSLGQIGQAIAAG